jgi:flagellar basal-body rod modification protein FlgD
MTTIPTTTAASGTSAPSSSLVNPKSILGKDDFLKLMVTQMKYQDPLKPMDNDQMVAQMSQLSSVEQLTNMAASNAAMAHSIGTSSAVGLIGRTVTWTDSSDGVHTGVVEKVNTAKDGTPTLTVAGTPGVVPSSITQVA